MNRDGWTYVYCEFQRDRAFKLQRSMSFGRQTALVCTHNKATSMPVEHLDPGFGLLRVVRRVHEL